MGRPTTKADLMTAATNNYKKLNVLVSGLTEKELSTVFDFANDEKKKEAHWKRDKNLRDIFIHLYEWHQLLLNWVYANQKKDEKPFIPKPYNWKTYGDMNVEFWKKHQNTSLEEAKEMVEENKEHFRTILSNFLEDYKFNPNIFETEQSQEDS